MAMQKQNKKLVGKTETKPTAQIWRRPISLAEYESEDPLETLYRGREVPETNKTRQNSQRKVVKQTDQPAASDIPEKLAKQKSTLSEITTNQAQYVEDDSTETEDNAGLTRVDPLTEDELKKILRIKNEFFRFTDIQEILRGKSLDIYAYLRLLAGETGFCKIKHLDFMRKLDISRPTLFKQEEWLVRLRLIEKRNVPGDHLGTSYTVHNLENVLPVSKALVKQLHARIETLHEEMG
jgi:hypothetical protein